MSFEDSHPALLLVLTALSMPFSGLLLWWSLHVDHERDMAALHAKNYTRKSSMGVRTKAAFLLFLFSMFVTWGLLNTLLSNETDRFLLLPGVERKVDKIVAVAILPFYLGSIVLTVRRWNAGSASAVRSFFRGLYTAVPLFALAAMAWAYVAGGIVAVFFFAASTPVSFPSAVTFSGVSRGYRSSGRNIVNFRLPDGSLTRLQSEDSTFARSLDRNIRVNGACELSDLPVGMPITVFARQSKFGYAVDRVTSSAPCGSR